MVLPVIALATVGVLSLRKDRSLVQAEASERAQRLAETLMPVVWEKFSQCETGQPTPGKSMIESIATRTNPASVMFQVGPTGELLVPREYQELPAPVPLDLAQLTSEQARLWFLAQQAETVTPDEARVTAAYESFLKLSPPKTFAALATFAQGIALSRNGENEGAKRAFQKVIEDFPDAQSEGGLPLKPLAEFKLIDSGKFPDSPTTLVTIERFCSNLVFQPTTLTPPLLEAASRAATSPAQTAALERWQLVWSRLDSMRAIAAAAKTALNKLQPARSDRPHLFGAPAAETNPPSLFWFDFPATSTIAAASGGEPTLSPERWVVVRCEGTNEPGWYWCRTEREIGTLITTTVEGLVPDYFAVGVEIAGRKITLSAPDLHVWKDVGYISKGAGQFKKEVQKEMATVILSSASKFTPGLDEFRVNIYLTSPSTLYRLQRTRTFWFGSLIAVSALAAAAGLWSGYRGFRRQLRLNELKSNFVSSVSHELRAPIAAVRLMAENLERGKVTEMGHQRDYYRLIRQECQRLSSLVENVLDFSRIEQGRKLYEFEPTDMRRLVEVTHELMGPYAAERGIELRLAQPLPAAGTEAVVDGKGIQQAIVNLIDNALKHSNQGEAVSVGVAVMAAGARSVVGGDEVDRGPGTVVPENGHCALTPEKERLAIWVEDLGEGIPPEEHRRIFDRFYRRGSELRRKTQGVGIGLSIVKHIVEAHRGLIRVESRPGKGSRFTIELPLRQELKAGSERQSEPGHERTHS